MAEEKILLGTKEGMPEEGELVLCTITRVYPTSVFATLDEYEKQGMISIGEISPGRIRNINDYVKIGKKVVCKILRVDKQKGHIDLSLRRVSDSQRRDKVNEIKQEQKAEKIIEFLAKELKEDTAKAYEKIATKVFQKYATLYDCFEEAAVEPKVLQDVGIDSKYIKGLQELIEQRIQPAEILLKGILTLRSYSINGLEDVRNALKIAEKEGVKVSYSGGGNYFLSITSEDKKTADKILTKAVEKSISAIHEAKGEGSFKRTDEK